MQASSSILTRYITGAIATLSLLYSFPLQAQLTPDTSLGTESSIVQFIDANRQDITGGALRGSNLFHSFQEFNVAQDRSVYFANPAVVENILTRVTGNNISNIFGTLGVDGNANLFLINPNGIYFGKDARLDISGSFTASTSDKIRLGENVWFGITTPPEELLTIKPETSFNYALQSYLGDITSEGQIQTGSDLNLQAQNLFLSGQIGTQGNLNLQAIDTIQMRDSIDNPLQIAAGQNLLVEGLDTVDIFALNHLDSGLWSGGDMVLRSANDVGGDAHFWSGGNFRVESLDHHLGNLWSPHDPIIRSYGDVSIGFYKGTSLHILAGGSVDIGTAWIWLPEISEAGGLGIDFLQEKIKLSDGTEIDIDGSTRPTLDVRAGVDEKFIQEIGISGFLDFPPYEYFADITWSYLEEPTLDKIPTSADITIGDIYINAPDGQVFLTNNYHPNLLLNSYDSDISVNGDGRFGIGILTAYKGDIVVDSRDNINFLSNPLTSPNLGIRTNGGDISIYAKNEVLIDGSLLTTSPYSFDGNSGNILIDTATLNVKNEGWISTMNLSDGEWNSGSLTILADELVEVMGDSDINTRLGENTKGVGGELWINTNNLLIKDSSVVSTAIFGDGRGGNLIVDAQQVELQNNGILGTSTYGNGDAGDLWIRNSQIVNLDNNSSIRTDSNNVNASGSAGRITIDTNYLIINNGSLILSATDGSGDGGNLDITASGFVKVINGNSSFSGISSSTQGSGSAGNIEVETGDLSLQESILTSSTSGIGNAGKLIIKASNSVDLIESNLLTGVVKNNSTGTGGDISLETKQMSLQNSVISTSTSGKGNAGNLTINVTESTEIGRGSLLSTSTQENANGNAGNIYINTSDLSLIGASIASSTYGEGAGGNITIDASNFIKMIGDENSSSGITADSIGSNHAGNIEINTNQLSIEDWAAITTSTSGVGDAGDLIVNATDTVIASGIGTIKTTVNDLSATGHGGDLIINTNKLFIDEGFQIGSGTFGYGNSGILTVNAAESINITDQGSGLFASSEGNGNANQININTKLLNISNQGQISATTFANGLGGDIIIHASDQINLDNGKIVAAADFGTTQNAGNIDIYSRDIFLQNQTKISTETKGQGNAGNINIICVDLLLNNGSTIVASTEGEGDSGNIRIIAPQFLTLDNNSQLTVETSGVGKAGDISISSNTINLGKDTQLSATVTEESTNIEGGGSITLNASNLNISGELGIFAETKSAAPAGNLTLQPFANQPNLNILFTDNGFISASTSASGNGGDISISAPELIDISGLGKISVESMGSGNAGDIKFLANKLNIVNGVTVSASTSNSGLGGNLFFNARESFSVNNSDLLTETTGIGNAGIISLQTGNLLLDNQTRISTETKGTGNAGDIYITAINLDTFNGSTISSATSNLGQAGNIKLTVANNLLLNGANTGIFANTAVGSSGNGGSINIDPINTIIRNGAGIGVDSQGSGQGGSIFLTSGNLSLDNGFISAATLSSNGGNISLEIADFLSLKNGSNITATAGLAGAGGNGGNITITAPWILSFPNQDNNIIANAFNGTGGNINITTNALLGIQFTGENIPVRNDISASSKFGLDGSVSINTPAVDPASGLTDLPENLVDADSLIKRNLCVVENQKIADGSSFIIKGKGGLPASPSGNLTARTAMVDFIDDPKNAQDISADEPQPAENSEEKLEVIQGWQRLPDGTVQLIGRSPQDLLHITPNSQSIEPVLQPPNCI